jgi:hypothetical protein
MPTTRDRIEATCPCGASLTVEASAKVCADRLDEFTKAHNGHARTVSYPYVQPVPYPVYPRYDRWYGATWTNGSSVDVTSSRINSASGGEFTINASYDDLILTDRISTAN